jgi:penicillin-binding protein 2
MVLRRLIILFVLVAVVMVVISLRLGQLQIAQAVKWQAEARTFIDRPHLVETSRGSILDCHGHALALDTACYDLAIDYRAMSLDDRWITQRALARLNIEGVTGRAARRAKLLAYKAQIVDQIVGNPEKGVRGIAQVVAQKCNVPIEEVVARLQAIRARIQLLRQARWSMQYDRNTDAENIAAGAYDLDSAMDFKEEQIAHTLVPAVSNEAAFYFEKHLDDYPGLVKIDSRRRTYPYGEVAAQVIGTLRRVNPLQIEAEPFQRDSDSDEGPRNLHGYLPMDQMGGAGVERMAEAKLRGSRGIRVIDTAKDAVIEAKSCAALPGRDVKLTLDIDLQKDLEAALKDASRNLLKGHDGLDHPVAVVILNAADSKVLAMVSLPGYDLNTYDEHLSELMHDETNHPLINRAVQSAYPPGSTVKGLVATAALSEKLVTPDETLTCNGHLFPNQPGAYRCWIYEDFHATHGPVHLETALEQSCNIYFYTMGMRLGYDRIAKWYRQFGFGAPTGIGLGEEDGRAPTPGAVTDTEAARREAIFLGIGQGPLQVTPIQMASAYATLLRGGLKIAPQVVESADAPPTSQLALAADQIPAVRAGLLAVVNNPHGTGYKAMRMNILVAGKTGTATAIRTVIENGEKHVKKDDDAWFVGYVPADQPKYVIVAVMEFGGHGGAAAAPMAREAIVQLERHDYLPKLDVPELVK